ncbi:MAG: metal-dependent hydrolase [Rhizobiaceae bacterium]
MKITWYGHSAFGLEFGDKKVLIDPFLTGNPSFEGQDKDAVIAGTTHVVLTHGHGDHLGDTIDIAGKTGAKIIGNADLCVWLGAKGVGNLDPGNTGGTLMQDGFSVTFVQAQHSSAMLDEDGVSHDLGHSNGVVFHIDGEKSVYHMGDTDIFGDMALIQELHAPQIAMVPIGDRFTMGGAVAALACRRFFKFDAIFPSHYATFPMVDQSAEKFLGAMEGDSDKVIVMKPGDFHDF